MKIPIKRLVNQCSKISETVADKNGFVAIRKLASECNCQVVSRALLVEAAITTTIHAPDTWVALLNEDIHRFSDEDIEFENHINHLHVRTRNTLAHEFAHAVACDLLGIDFVGSGNFSDRIKSIENAVEKVSTTLLVPKSYLISLLCDIKDTNRSLQELSNIYKCFAVSREAFINTIKIFKSYYPSDFLQCEYLQGASWGIAEFSSKNVFRTYSKLIFSNYSKFEPHPATYLIKEKHQAKWIIESIVKEGESVYCAARPDDACKNINLTHFEIETIPHGKRQKMFFRLADKYFSRPHREPSLAYQPTAQTPVDCHV